MSNDEMKPVAEPAFKGSAFSAQEYRDAWGDDWHTVFMQLSHQQEGSQLCD
jgi:hypothetical protein